MIFKKKKNIRKCTYVIMFTTYDINRLICFLFFFFFPVGVITDAHFATLSIVMQQNRSKDRTVIRRSSK